MLESWKHCVASGCTEAAAARTVIMEKTPLAYVRMHGSNLFSII